MILKYRHCETLDDAIKLLAEVVDQQDGGDSNYFKSQSNRYRYSIQRIIQLCPQPRRVLDIGSHYLHQSVLLSLLGYEVTGLDVPLFTGAGFVRERAHAMRINNITSAAHASGEFLQGHDGCFDLIVCTEMLEHIAFNPVAFWRQIWRLLSNDSMIYLTTPNAFRLRAVVKTLIRLLTFEGIGLPIDEVLTVITYGHHWKEYSTREIRKYFRQLSPDFVVEAHTYPDSESRSALWTRALEILPPFRSNIEAVIRLGAKTGFAASPALPMMLKTDGQHMETVLHQTKGSTPPHKNRGVQATNGLR